MDGNKDEALRCIGIAKEAFASGNKHRALKFIGIARRLDHNLSVDDLLIACESLDSETPVPSNNYGANNEPVVAKVDEDSHGEPSYSEENVQLIREIKRIHPDKNKAPGSEEAFKKVSKAFKCLSNDDSRTQYDQTGLVEEFEHNQQYNVRRRRRTGNDFFHEDFDSDEIFRAFFGQTDMFREARVYRTRRTTNQHQEDFSGGGPNLTILFQLVPFLLIVLLAYLPFSEPDYSLQKNHSYQFHRTTEKHGVEFYVKSPEFDQNFPVGSPARGDVENYEPAYSSLQEASGVWDSMKVFCAKMLDIYPGESRIISDRYDRKEIELNCTDVTWSFCLLLLEQPYLPRVKTIFPFGIQVCRDMLGLDIEIEGTPEDMLESEWEGNGRGRSAPAALPPLES
ncbi:hypothetical protein C3L33_14863, partial [Rhododendron williamsianum]